MAHNGPHHPIILPQNTACCWFSNVFHRRYSLKFTGGCLASSSSSSLTRLCFSVRTKMFTILAWFNTLKVLFFPTILSLGRFFSLFSVPSSLVSLFVSHLKLLWHSRSCWPVQSLQFLHLYDIELARTYHRGSRWCWDLSLCRHWGK